MSTQIQRQTCSSTTCWRSFKYKREVLQIGLHLQSLPFSISRIKNHGKTPGFGSAMSWHENDHLWPKKTMFCLSIQGAAARELICCKVTHCSRGITFFKFNWSFDGWEEARSSLGNRVQSANSKFTHVNNVHSKSETNLLWHNMFKIIPTQNKKYFNWRLHLQGLPFSISRNKNHGKTPGFC